MVLFSYYPTDPRPRRAAEALVSFGMSVELICVKEGSHEAKREVVNGLDVTRVPVKRYRGSIFGYICQYSSFLFICSAIIALRSLRHRYDLIYVHNMPDFLVVSGLIPKVFGAKIILDLHDPMPELMMTIFDLPKEVKSVRLLKLLEKWSIRLADSVVTVNLACAKLFASRSCPAQKITVVMNSPDEKIFRIQSPHMHPIAQRGVKPFVIMYHGSLVERNGLDIAIEAFARLRPLIPAAELRIYGPRTSFLERVMDAVRMQGLGDTVRYLGQKSHEEIVQAIGACDVGIIPNHRNIFTELNTPSRIFEYLAVGKPVIAPRAPGICDYFDDQSLILFELGNAEDLARKIVYSFQNPDDTREIAKRGQEVHRTHTWSNEKVLLTRLLAELLPGAGARSLPVIHSTNDHQCNVQTIERGGMG